MYQIVLNYIGRKNKLRKQKRKKSNCVLQLKNISHVRLLQRLRQKIKPLMTETYDTGEALITDFQSRRQLPANITNAEEISVISV